MPTEASFLRVLSIASCLVACTPPLPPPATGLDGAGIDAFREDGGPIFVHDTGPHDTGVSVMDANFDANVDAAAFDAASADAGPMIAITLDGMLDDDFWMMGASTTVTTPIVTPYEGDSLTKFSYARDSAWLYIGFEGTLASGDALVVYVDTHFGDGVPLNGGLGDNTSALNRVFSLPITATAEFQPEYGWGTAAMPVSRGPGDTRFGWRQLAMNPGIFAPVITNTTSVCSATGCETAMLLAQLGIPTGGPIALVVRIGRPGVGFSNQTIPSSDASTPELIVNGVMVPLAPPAP